MINRILSVGLMSAITFFGSTTQIQALQHHAQSTAKTVANESDFASTWTLLCDVANKIEKEHVSPPVRQQLFLSAAKGMYSAYRQPIPRTLADEFSQVISDADIQKLCERVWRELEKQPDFSAETTQSLAASGLLNGASLGMRYITAEENRIAKQLSENQYVGIGIRVSYRNEIPRIDHPFIGGPAQIAGAKPLDLILEIDGKPTQGRPFRELLDELRGPKGSEVTVVLQNENESEKRSYTMIRNVVPIPTVKGAEQHQDGNWDINFATMAGYEDDQKIAYIKFDSIVGSTAAELNQLALQVNREKFENVILDFRNVPNPELHHMVMLADSLTSSVDLGVVRSVDDESPIRTGPDSVLANQKILVLANRNVPGPLFMLLSGLKNDRRISFIGDQIFSNGHCVKTIDMQNGAIEGCPYGICIPKVTGEQLAASRNLMGDQIRLQGGFVLQADIQGSEQPQELVRKILEHFSS